MATDAKKKKRIMSSEELSSFCDQIALMLSSGMTLLFGFLIIFNPGMTMMSVWVFTGITLIIEGILDGTLIFMQVQKQKETEK